jgi:hypothetical protein
MEEHPIVEGDAEAMIAAYITRGGGRRRLLVHVLVPAPALLVRCIRGGTDGGDVRRCGRLEGAVADRRWVEGRAVARNVGGHRCVGGVRGGPPPVANAKIKCKGCK